MSDIERVTVGEIQTAYIRSGEGPPLVLIHGGEGNRYSFDSIKSVLTEHFTVITYDQRDSGDTVNPAEPYEMADFGRDVGDLIEALGYEKAHVFGTSMGGMIAQNAALERPSRMDRLVLSATVAGKPGDMPMSARALELSRSQEPGAKEEFMKLYFSKKNREPENWPAASAIMNNSRSRLPRTPEMNARRMQAAMKHDTYARLAGITCPTLVIGAEEDEVIPPEHSRYLAANIPQATLKMLPEAGHVWWAEQPTLFAQLLKDFLLR